MRLSIIVALSENGTIGRDGDLPWRLPADLKRFRRLTMDHHLIVGRKTWESIGRPLPGRTMLVVTRRPDYEAEGVRVVSSVREALELAGRAGETEAFVGGGAEIYRSTLPHADRLYVTRVHAEVDGDTFFPEYDVSEWHLVARDHRLADQRHAYDFSFETYERERG